MPNYRSPVNGQPLPQGVKITSDTAREYNKKSVESRRKRNKIKKTLKEQLELLLAEQRKDNTGKSMTVQAGITASLVKAALEGNTKAYEIIRDTIGQKPADAVIVNAPDADIMAEIRKRMEQLSEP